VLDYGFFRLLAFCRRGIRPGLFLDRLGLLLDVIPSFGVAVDLGADVFLRGVLGHHADNDRRSSDGDLLDRLLGRGVLRIVPFWIPLVVGVSLYDMFSPRLVTASATYDEMPRAALLD
jgi:hypothetical protein